MKLRWHKNRALEYAQEQEPRIYSAWVDPKGYIQIRFQRHGKSFRFHRYITQKRLGVKLSPLVHIHHKNHDRLNNTPRNLEPLSIEEHARHHPRDGWVSEAKRESFSASRRGTGNPNFGNHKKRKPKPREEVERMRLNQPNYVHVDRDVLVEALRVHRTASKVCKALGISSKVLFNRRRQYGLTEVHPA